MAALHGIFCKCNCTVVDTKVYLYTKTLTKHQILIGTFCKLILPAPDPQPGLRRPPPLALPGGEERDRRVRGGGRGLPGAHQLAHQDRLGGVRRHRRPPLRLQPRGDEGAHRRRRRRGGEGGGGRQRQGGDPGMKHWIGQYRILLHVPFFAFYLPTCKLSKKEIRRLNATRYRGILAGLSLKCFHLPYLAGIQPRRQACARRWPPRPHLRAGAQEGGGGREGGDPDKEAAVGQQQQEGREGKGEGQQVGNDGFFFQKLDIYVLPGFP